MEDTQTTEPRLHVMLDIETMGTGPDAAIVAIGAVKFDPFLFHKGYAVGKPTGFYAAIDLTSSMESGGVVDGGTVMWWLQQTGAARSALLDGNPLELSLQHFSDWYGSDRNVPVWGNGATFDNVIVRRAYQRLGLDAPWSHRVDRCFRTLKNLFPGVEPPPQIGTSHNALDDALWQAEYMQRIFQGGTCCG